MDKLSELCGFPRHLIYSQAENWPCSEEKENIRNICDERGEEGYGEAVRPVNGISQAEGHSAHNEGADENWDDLQRVRLQVAAEDQLRRDAEDQLLKSVLQTAGVHPNVLLPAGIEWIDGRGGESHQRHYNHAQQQREQGKNLPAKCVQEFSLQSFQPWAGCRQTVVPQVGNNCHPGGRQNKTCHYPPP